MDITVLYQTKYFSKTVDFKLQFSQRSLDLKTDFSLT